MADDNNPYVPGGAESAFGPSSGSQGGQALSPDALSLLVQSMTEMGYKISQDITGDVAEQVRSILESSSGARYMTARLRGMANVINKMPVGEERSQATAQYQQLTGAVEQTAPGVTAPLYTAQGQSQYQLQQAVQQTVKSNEEQYRQSYLNFANSALNSGQNLTDAELAQIRKYAEELRKQANEKRETLVNLGEPQTEQDRGQQIQLRNELSNLNNEASGFERTLERGLQQQNQDNQKLLSFIGNVVGSLALGQLSSQFLLRDPFRFETAPALTAAGRTSDMGQIVSQALRSAEEYSLNLNTTGLQIGAGVGAAGFATLRRGQTMPDTPQNRGSRALLRGAGGAGLLLGAGIGGAALSGVFDDALQALPIVQSDDDIIGTEIAREVLNAPRLAQFYQTSRAGLLQRGAGADLGFAQGAEGGNLVLSDIARRQSGLSGMSLEELGYSTSDIGGLLSAAAMSMRGSGENLDQAVELAGNMQALFGVSSEQTFGTLASIQRAGFSPDQTRNTFLTSMGVVADEEGQLSNFAANVLVPALNQVLESTAIRNVARSTEELQRDVFGFRQALEGDDRLGRLIESSPETFARIFQGTQSAVQQATSDPGLLAYFRSIGASFGDIYSGSPQVGVAALNNFVRGGVASGRLSANTTQEQLLSFIGPYVSSGVLPFSDPQVAASIVRRVLQGEEFSTESDLDVAVSEAQSNLQTRAGNLPTDLATLLEEMAKGTTDLNEQMNNSVDTLIRMQQSIQDFIDDESFDSKLDQGMARITAAFYRQMGMTDVATMYNPKFASGGSVVGAANFLGENLTAGNTVGKTIFANRFADIGELIGIDTFEGPLSNVFTAAFSDFIVNNPDLAMRLLQDAKGGFSERERNRYEEEGIINNDSQVQPGATGTTNNFNNPGQAQALANVQYVIEDATASV